METLRTLPVGTVVKVPLGQIATVEQADAQGSITRIDGSPAASITADIADVNTGAVSAGVQTEIDGLVAAGQIPSTSTSGSRASPSSRTRRSAGCSPRWRVAILIVYLAMVLTFNSLVTPFIILFTLPLATIGAFPALFLTGRPIGISALIGFLMLIGIVVTNAIVLLDLVERLRREGMSTYDALIEGGRTRVRPILMTAIATILALVPLAAGFNQGSIIAAELGTVVIGGLLSSTFLTLLVIPVVYSLVDGAPGRVSAERSRVRADDAAEPPLAAPAHAGSRRGAPIRPPATSAPSPRRPWPHGARARGTLRAEPEDSRWPSRATPTSPGRATCSSGSGHHQLRLVGRVLAPAGDLGLADRGAQRADEPRGADRRGARVVLLDGVQRAAREERHAGRRSSTCGPRSRSTRATRAGRSPRSDITVRGTVPGIDAGEVRGARRGRPRTAARSRSRSRATSSWRSTPSWRSSTAAPKLPHTRHATVRAPYPTTSTDRQAWDPSGC